ncbi:MAG: hypothetical protein IPG87_03285 [Saprospiraceae bacterium]|nr:hypothetical protein [Candidatus Vicinibacter affinis]
MKIIDIIWFTNRILNLPILVFIFFFNIILIGQQSHTPILFLNAGSGITLGPDSSVVSWKDNVSGNQAVQNNPNARPKFIKNGINGLPSIQLNGKSSYMDFPSVFPVLKDYTLFLIIKTDAPSYNLIGGANRTLWLGGNTKPQMLHQGNFNSQVISTVDPGLDPALVIAEYNQSTQRGTFYINAQFADSAFCPSNIDSTIFIGAYNRSYFYNGSIGTIILFPGLLPTNTRDSIQKKLMAEYKIPGPPILDSSILSVPGNHHFFARDQNDLCNFEVKGYIFDSKFDSVFLKLYQNDQLISNLSTAIYFSNQKALYQFSPVLKSGLLDYRMELTAHSASGDSSLFIRNHLLCGDVFLINGQSNSIFGGSNDSDPFVKTFGLNYSQNKKDTFFTPASASGYGGGPDIGAWGMQLAKNIVKKHKVPVCVINGGVGGTSIQQHQRNDSNPAEPNSIYGSFLYRINQSKLGPKVKFLCWYQGESNATPQYFENFKSLYQDWKNDLPLLKKIYVMQIHHGCGTGDNSGVREIQRNLPKSFPDITVMSTNGLPGHDGCHYSVDGYRALAEWLSPLVEKDFYNGPELPDMTAPNLKYAYYTTPSKNRINLVFEPGIQEFIIPSDTVISNVKIRLIDYFYLDGLPFVINNISAQKDTVLLDLKTGAGGNFLTYLPEIYYHNSSTIFQGPYITNSRNIGALSFYQVPVLSTAPVGIGNISSDLTDFLYFNNPSSRENLLLKIKPNNYSGALKLIILSLQGQILYSQNLDNFHTEQTISFPALLSGSGMLLWKIYGKDFCKTGKIVIKG